MFSRFYLMIMIAGCSPLLLIVRANQNQISSATKLNNNPVLGVLSYLEDGRYTSIRQYLPTSYVKFLEGAGARVIPVFCCQYQANYYKNLLSNSINGILLPDFKLTEPFRDWNYGGAFSYTIYSIMDVAKELNKNGHFFPVWSVGTSFIAMLNCFASDNIRWLKRCNFHDVSFRLHISNFVKQDPSKTQMFRDKNQTMPDIIQILETEDIAYFDTQFCIDNGSWPSLEFAKEFKVISTIYNDQVDYVTTVEHNRFPFYGSLWMPQVHQFEFNNEYNAHVNHGRIAIRVAQYFSNFFVNESRKNPLRLKPWDSVPEKEKIIRYDPAQRHFTGLKPKEFCQEKYKFIEECYYRDYYHTCFVES